jgi:hypothetical protein
VTHVNDDELLELALLKGEPDARENAHVAACAECQARYRAVLAEQDLLRRAMAPVEAPARVERAVLGPRRPSVRWAAAAALLVGALAGAGLARLSDPPRASSAPLSIVKVEDELRQIPSQIATLRDAEPSRLEHEYPRVMSRAGELYADFLSLYVEGAAPLTEEQRGEIREAVDALSTKVWLDSDAAKLAGEFRATLRSILNPPQFQAFRERLLIDMESDWAEEIDIVTDDVAEALNLRFSEEEGVRAALRAAYPKTELPLLSLAHWPPDRLAEDGTLATRVRGSLAAGYHAAFDAYVEGLRDGHRRIAKVARALASGQGR